MSKERDNLTFVKEANGHRFYKFSNWENIPMIRRDVFMSRYEELEKFNLSQDSIFKAFELIEERLNAGKIIDAATLAGHVKYLMMLPINTYTLTYITSSLVLVDDEKEDSLEVKYEVVKKEFGKTEEGKAFFLNCLTDFSSSGKPFQNSMKLLRSLSDPQNLMIEKKFYSQIAPA